MKNIIKTIFLLVLTTGGIYAQSDWNILTRVPSGNNKILVRWMPPTSTDWSDGVSNGYIITRKEYDASGVFITNSTTTFTISAINSEDTLQTKWTQYWKADSIIYKQLFYLSTNSLALNSVRNSPLSNPVSTSLEERYFYANILADERFKAAELCGLGFSDVGLAAGKRYTYSIRVNKNGGIESPATEHVIVNTSNLPDIPIKFTSENKRLKINWGDNTLQDYYSGYWVEKSTNGGSTYSRLNNIPYINLNAQLTQKMVYIDSIPNSNATYRYRVIGIGYFDELKTGTARDTTITKKQEFSPGINRVKAVGSNFKIDWKYPYSNPNSLPVNVNNDLISYTIGVSRLDNAKLGTSDFKTIASNVSKTDTSYQFAKSTIPSLLGDTLTNRSIFYYYIVSFGVGGSGGIGKDTVYSAPYAYKPTFIDNTPPLKVTSLNVSDPVNIANQTKMSIKVSWNNTTDNPGGIGVLGYRVFRTIGTDKEKIEVSGGIVAIPDGANRSLTYDTLSQNLDYKSIKYFVSAFDSLYNESPVDSITYRQKDSIKPLPSRIIGIDLKPDNTVEIKFIPSPSKKLEPIKQEIRRKEGISGTWSVIRTVLNNETITSYLDSQVSGGKIYYYVISAVDDSSNYSCDTLPQLVGPKGFQTTPKGCIIEVEVKTLNLSTKDPLASLTQAYSEASKSVSLNWVIPSNWGGNTITGYEIYRGNINPSITTKPAFLDFASGSSILSYLDTKVDFDSTYLYKVRANFADGSVSSWKDVQTASLKLSKLSVDKSFFSFERTANSQSIIVTSNIAWTISSNVSWLTPSVSSGSNNATINLNVSANTGNAKRTGVLTISGAGLTSTIDIEQFAPPTGTGITAKYYNYTSLNDIQTREPNISRLETQINIGTGGSPASGIFNDFVAIWEGEIEVPQNGNYTFYVSADDGALLYLNGNKIITTNFSEVASSIQTLSAGQKYPIRLEYWDASSWSGVTLQWSNNVGLSKQVITTPYLYPKSIPTANDADPLHNKCFVMRNTSTDKTFQSPGDYSFKELTYNSKNYQKWKFVKNGSGYNIISQIDAQNKTLQVINDGNNLYDKLTIGYLGNKSSEIWNVTNQWGNTYQIQRAASSLYIGPGWDDYPRLFNGGQNINLESTDCPNYSTGIMLDTDELTYDYQQQTKSILLKSDVEWTTINYNDWISVTPPYGLQNTTVNVMLSKNPLMQPRDGVIGFKSNNGIVNVKINQGPKPCIEVSNISTECSVKSISGVYIDGSNSFNSGVYEFSVDNTNNWKPYQWQIQFLTNGEHILHVRKIAEPTCTGSMSFSIYCN
jgi:hypothetical protein